MISLDGIVSSLPSPRCWPPPPAAFSSTIWPAAMTDPVFLSRRSTLSCPRTRAWLATTQIRAVRAIKPMYRRMEIASGSFERSGLGHGRRRSQLVELLLHGRGFIHQLLDLLPDVRRDVV